jgi:hypothetical protein
MFYMQVDITNTKQAEMSMLVKYNQLWSNSFWGKAACLPL